MPESTPQIRVWSIALEHLRKISEAFKKRGEMSKSMTAIASEAILSIPMPNGSKPVADHEEENTHAR